MKKQNKYPSKYSNGKTVSAAQYITELICERKAAKDSLDLHYRFWTNKNWQVFYKNQIGSANKLLKKFSDKAIIRALNTTSGKKIYSLRAPHLIDMIIKEESAMAHENTIFTKIVDRKSEVLFRPNRDKKTNNIISKLKELDNES